jgi:type IV secretory pathway VirB4 component
MAKPKVNTSPSPRPSGKAVKKGKYPSAQRSLPIAEIKEDCVVLKDGTLRAVLLVSSINFSLKSEEEQNAIIAAYVNFLNAIDFPLQILIQSRKLNIGAYLGKLEQKEKEQTNELLKLQIAEYRQYISELVELGEIMTKRFFLVIPHNPLSDKQKGWFKRLLEVFKAAGAVRLSQERFAGRRRELMQRADHVMGTLASIGLKAVVVDTQGLIELYYTIYNPGVAERQKLVDLNQLQVEP